MPRQRQLTNEQEAAALALHRAGLSVAECARTYHLSWQGMRDCLDRATERETKSPSFTGNLEAGAVP